VRRFNSRHPAPQPTVTPSHGMSYNGVIWQPSPSVPYRNNAFWPEGQRNSLIIRFSTDSCEKSQNRTMLAVAMAVGWQTNLQANSISQDHVDWWIALGDTKLGSFRLERPAFHWPSPTTRTLDDHVDPSTSR
jgi:hypothetical protein